MKLINWFHFGVFFPLHKFGFPKVTELIKLRKILN
jgi:hypothetical protein